MLCWCMQDVGLIFLSAMATSIAEIGQEVGLNDAEVVGTAMLTLTVATTLVGILTWCVGKSQGALSVVCVLLLVCCMWCFGSIFWLSCVGRHASTVTRQERLKQDPRRMSDSSMSPFQKDAMPHCLCAFTGTICAVLCLQLGSS